MDQPIAFCDCGARNSFPMPRQHTPSQLGHFRIIRALRACEHGDRFLAVDQHSNENVTLYRLPIPQEPSERRRLLAAVERLATFNPPHALPLRTYTMSANDSLWLASPFTGNHEGLVLLSDLIELRGGPLSSVEVGHAVSQTLEVVLAAHREGLSHGPLELEQIQIDRRGSVHVELYGLARLRDGLSPANDLLIRDELRSVVCLAYTLLTGMTACEPRIRASRLIKKLDRSWDQWIEHGLDPFGGFATAEEAIAALPGNTPADEPRPSVKVLSRFAIPARTIVEAR